MTLSRTIVEDVVTAWWCHGQQQDALFDRHLAHEKSTALRLQSADRRDLQRLRTFAHYPTLPADVAERIRQDDDVDERSATRHWTGQTVKALGEASRGWMRPAEIEKVDRLLGLPLLVANLTTHNSPMSVATVMGQSDGYHHLLSRRPSDVLVHDALAIIYDAMALLAPLVVAEARLGVIDEMVARDSYLFTVVTEAPEGRNGPCPCGSGRKYKRCHGSTVRPTD
jgi:hypothetical protein